jgi:hypothetical protein
MAARAPRGQNFNDKHIKKFGLKKIHDAPVIVQCNFCFYFGREEKVGAKRKQSTNVQCFEAGSLQPFNYKQHITGAHPIKWALYQALEDDPQVHKVFWGDPMERSPTKQKKAKFQVLLEKERRKRTETTKALISPVEVTYGTHEEGIIMRKWLDEHSLPQSVGDAMVVLGARCVNDIVMLIQECPELLSGLAPLDLVKLKKAVNTDEM